jgi:hypothetical protein
LSRRSVVPVRGADSGRFRMPIRRHCRPFEMGIGGWWCRYCHCEESDDVAILTKRIHIIFTGTEMADSAPLSYLDADCHVVGLLATTIGLKLPSESQLREMHFQFIDSIHDEVRVGRIVRIFTPHSNPGCLHANTVSADDIGIRVVPNEQNFFCLNTRNI